MIKTICLSLILISAAHACGPYFPSSYLSDYDHSFSERINLSEELELIAQEYDLIDGVDFPYGWEKSSLKADIESFQEKANAGDKARWADLYAAYAKAVRAGDTNAVAPALPDYLKEFTLYLDGTREFMADESVRFPKAWKELLALSETNRAYRTVWTHYMLGNLASSRGLPDEASLHYADCRSAAKKLKHDSQLGLAHASYKREYLAQTNLAARLERGIAAVGYYHQGWARDKELADFCMEHLQLDMRRARDKNLAPPNMAVLEAMALFNAGDKQFIETMAEFPELKITPRLAWFMYKSGEIEMCRTYLDLCPEEDIVANWLRYRLAQRAGDTDQALAFLKKWIAELPQSDRIVFDFGYRANVSTDSALFGSMGTLYASKGQMMDALISFVSAGAYQDAALIAERFMATDELKRYVDGFDQRAPYHQLPDFDAPLTTETYTGTIELRLSYLLARRLMREGRPEEALPYYPPEFAELLLTYLDARKKASDFWSTPNTRAAHLYHAARIMRWKGMELCGTELYPDYTIINGYFPDVGMGKESELLPPDTVPAYAETAPVPNIRFHYRHLAAQLAGEAADLAWNRHQKAMILWSAGMWIQNRHPKAADVFYKKLARLHHQPLANAADQLRWFPEPTPMMTYVHRNETYVPPDIIVQAAQNYND
ncbi:MAG: hypothetical protein JXR25_01605 [Pontiellaceae bacterium]|nr:hypothetical protein [Pontiellaceae bacterium]MBN2783495.1 hypothetical protein [Pontiellaceae bacterium]